MAEVVRVGEARVRYAPTRLGEVVVPPLARGLATAIGALDAAGLCPVLDDGFAGGNGAVVVSGRLFLTPSGRRPGPLDPEELVELASFDPSTWSAAYRGREGLRPTSDAPLYDAILREAAQGWARLPGVTPPSVALHGHALESEREAARIGAPISSEETEFSTPEDRAALIDLVRRFPWPAHRVWIRRGHGFFVVGTEIEETLAHALSLVG